MNSPLNNGAAFIGAASTGNNGASIGAGATSAGVPFTIDTEVFLQNCNDFTARFPEQAARLGLNRPETALQCLQAVPPAYRLVQAKAKGMEHTPTLAVNGSFVHSKYNPQEEARRILDSEFFQTAEAQSRCIFTGLGLGYLASQYIERFPAAEAVIIEADRDIFLCCLAARPLDSFFRHRRLSLLIGTQPEESASFLASTGWNNKILFKAPVSSETYKSWYGTFFTLLERNKMKNSINAKTLERFGTLWLKNTVKNLDMLCTTAKIGCFKNAFPDAVAVVLAGGPSLAAHLEQIKKSGKDFLIIAVDTALRACLRAGITPDFILSFDPQYWNYLHTAGLDTSKSILISEAAVFPAVLRQRYRAVFLSESSVPFARYLESKGKKQNGDEDCVLAAGGSVATTAWDFARYIGAKPVIMAGLDLAYPGKQTHFAGSTFEEAVHTRSTRVASAEQANFNSLYSAFPSLHQDYAGGTVLTDRRMLLYAWWFESTLAKYPEVKTFNLMPHGVFIPGMPACTAEDFAGMTGGLPRVAIDERLETLIKNVYSQAFLTDCGARKRQLAASVKAMTESAAGLAAQAEKAEALCRRLAEYNEAGKRESGNSGNGSGTREQAALIAQLNKIDENIKNGFAKDLVAVLFFNDETGKDSDLQPIAAAENIYKRIRLMALQAHDIFKSRQVDIF
ncbi:motility associated factor glycosyltransferase family protein [Treponema sp. OMZ 906]|uniref:motility associated factor glycosyltransferase family protein n=1 Tax=Treponema sp. OMZ 906 TaxID=2563662 RepID=UPI0020A61447|nr:6-hydroxymethylpterin diphosphokinase MptE-like protein [Treponema sp. OMZ 906]UTC55701.1 motility associated factor glycosyltransferase family protein [Treponema sp. OMZ 906]